MFAGAQVSSLYASMPDRITRARNAFGRPLTLSEKILVAQAVSSVLLAGWHTKMRRRLGESCGTWPLYGPTIWRLFTAASIGNS